MTDARMERRLDRASRILLGCVVGVLLVLVVFGGVTLWRATSAATTGEEVARGNELAGCRAAARSAVDAASAELDAARSADDLLWNQALEAIGLSDAARFREVTAGASPVRARIVGAQAKVTAATDAYAAAVAASIEDPDTFLATCKENP